MKQVMNENSSTEDRARAFMPKDQFELHINMTPGELRNITRRLLIDFATQEVQRERIAAEEKGVREFIRRVLANPKPFSGTVMSDTFREMFNEEL